MIHRANYHHVRQFIRYRADVLDLDEATLHGDKHRLNWLLIWADDTPFNDRAIEGKRPTFQRWLVDQKPVGYNSGEQFTPETNNKIVLQARMFFEWATIHLREYRTVSRAWVDSLRAVKMDEIPKDRQAVSLDMVRQLVGVEWGGMSGLRAKAAAAFLFLSGMRATAFCTMPIRCVDLDNNKIWQYPSMGTRTKNRKSAVTMLYNIPDLMAVVREWDTVVRATLPDTAPWYAALDTNSTATTQTLMARASAHGHKFLRLELHQLFQRAGLPYLSPHKFRHGHATFGVLKAKDMAEYKAVSKNLMHATIATTDRVYANLTNDQTRGQIETMINRINGNGHAAAPEVSAIAAEVVRQLKQEGMLKP